MADDGSDTGEHAGFLGRNLVANSDFLVFRRLFIQSLLPLVDVHPRIADILVELGRRTAHPFLNAVRVALSIRIGLFAGSYTCLSCRFGFSFADPGLAHFCHVVLIIIHHIWNSDDIALLFTLIRHHAGYFDYWLLRQGLAVTRNEHLVAL